MLELNEVKGSVLSGVLEIDFTFVIFFLDPNPNHLRGQRAEREGSSLSIQVVIILRLTLAARHLSEVGLFNIMEASTCRLSFMNLTSGDSFFLVVLIVGVLYFEYSTHLLRTSSAVFAPSPILTLQK